MNLLLLVAVVGAKAAYRVALVFTSAFFCNIEAQLIAPEDQEDSDRDAGD